MSGSSGQNGNLGQNGVAAASYNLVWKPTLCFLHGTDISELKQWLIYDLGCMVGYNVTL